MEWGPMNIIEILSYANLPQSCGDLPGARTSPFPSPSTYAINSCRTYKLLGVYFDENMSFDYHIASLCNKLNRSLHCINKAKNFLTTKSLLTLYFALVYSHLTHCPIIVSCTSTPNINRVLKTQKKSHSHCN
jgi:hypothetical protein